MLQNCKKKLYHSYFYLLKSLKNINTPPCERQCVIKNSSALAIFFYPKNIVKIVGHFLFSILNPMKNINIKNSKGFLLRQKKIVGHFLFSILSPIKNINIKNSKGLLLQ